MVGVNKFGTYANLRVGANGSCPIFEYDRSYSGHTRHQLSLVVIQKNAATNLVAAKAMVQRSDLNIS
jgi:hypothetical protein